MSKQFFAAALALAGIMSAQTLVNGPKPSGPRMVLVDVMVSDKDIPVKGLKAENFVLEDGGKKQNIALFDVTESGKLRTPAVTMPPGVVSNKISAKGEIQPTASVLLYDRVNSDALDQSFVREQILKVLAGLKDTDRMGFYSIGLNGLQLVSDYDENAALLAKAARALLAGNTAPADATPEEKGMFNALFAALTPTQEMANQARVEITYPTFQMIGRHMGGVLGRKNLMWIASAFPLTFGNQQERRQDDQREVEKFIRYMTENNIAVYTIDPSGTGSTSMTGQEGLGETRGGAFAERGGAPVANEGAILAAEGGGALRNSAGTSAINLTNSSLNGTQSMLIVADATGGKTYRNGNDISIALREVLSAAEYTYTLGFYPEAASLNGSNRDVKVTLTKTDLKAKITHRKYYYAWGPNTPKDQQDVPNLQQVLNQGLPATKIGLMAMANPQAPESGNTVVDVRISAADLRFDWVDGKWNPDFELVIIAEGSQPIAKTFAAPQTTLTDEQMRLASDIGISLREVIPTGTKAGWLHIALVDKKSGAAGKIVLPYKAAATAPATAVAPPAEAAPAPRLILQ